jgi:Major Facilitator Superfamily
VTTRRGLVWVLGLGAFGLAFSLSTTAAYLPPLLEKFTDSNTMIAAVLAAEGAFALTLPLVIGPWSDTFKTPIGRRRPFMLAALGPLGFCLAIVAFMPNIWTMTLIVLAFFFAYYVYEPPYRGLYPDVLHESLYGRSQGVQHVLRGIALGIALVGGGFLFKVWHPAPFLLASVATTAACGAVILWVHEAESEGSRVFRGLRSYVRTSWTVFWEVPEVRRFLFAQAAWEGTFAAMRTFVVLYITKGLGQPVWPGPCDLRRVVRLRRRPACRRPRPGVAQLVLRAHLSGRRRRRHGDDTVVGAALQADAPAASGRDFRPGDDDQGARAPFWPTRRRGDDRRDEAVPLEDGRLWNPLAGLCSAGARGDPARRLADPARVR